MTAYIQTATTRPDGSRDSFATITVGFSTMTVDSKIAPLWWHDKGLSYTASGYGKRIPTRYMVRFNDKWRRVYCCIYSNAGTCYIGKLSDGLIVSHIEG